MNLQDHYQKAIAFAGEKHADQKIPGSNASYLLHLSNVAMEVMVASQYSEDFDLALATQVALLHDVLEDTQTTMGELEDHFGTEIAESVLALTKNEKLGASDQIPDSLIRIRELPKEIWAVKLADRISNMQKPPSHWDRNQTNYYRIMAEEILQQLEGGNEYLEKRLKGKILEYGQYIDNT